ncbi:MAG TPA: hypothetical protein VMJ64_18060 [Anaerolineales bacterium]|nr:hypothetical protein [Anaerolineales bacterium]
MNKIPFRQQPAFRSLLLGVALLGIYVYYIFWGGGFWSNAVGIALDLLLLMILYPICRFFYSQFILPTRTWDERQQIAARLRLHAGHGHGPAIFVRNGRKVERTGESDKSGPGVLWIDTASAVVTRTPLTFKRVLGPGVHFIAANEKIGSVISLHPQNQSLGPIQGDNPFTKLKDNPTDEEGHRFTEMRTRCMAVRATTRDGHEIFPTLNVSFKIDARPAKPGQKGSRFGFNAEAVERAARSEGVNPASSSEDKRRVAWNQLPGLMAAELWREYLGKFTLNELFEATQKPLPTIHQPEIPPSTMAAMPPPLIIRSDYRSRLLRNFNNDWEKRLNVLMPPEPPAPEEEIHQAQLAGGPKPEATGQTALQIINQMIKARLSQAVVVKLDECGRPTEGQQVSDEYRKLTERGIVVLGAGAGSLLLDPEAERQLLYSWTSSWLTNAREDQKRIERLGVAYAEKGRHAAQLDHALELSEAFNKAGPASVPAAVAALLLAAEDEIRTSDRLQSMARSELELLRDLEKWLEEK